MASYSYRNCGLCHENYLGSLEKRHRNRNQRNTDQASHGTGPVNQLQPAADVCVIRAPLRGWPDGRQVTDGRDAQRADEPERPAPAEVLRQDADIKPP